MDKIHKIQLGSDNFPYIYGSISSHAHMLICIDLKIVRNILVLGDAKVYRFRIYIL